MVICLFTFANGFQAFLKKTTDKAMAEVTEKNVNQGAGLGIPWIRWR